MFDLLTALAFVVYLISFVPGYHIIDLTWDIDNDTVNWVNTRSFEYTKMIAEYADKGYWYAANEFCMAEHGGTHFDAPYHFSQNGWKVGDVPVERLLAEGFMLDVSKMVEEEGSSFVVLPKHLEQWSEQIGEIPRGSVLLIRTGWSKFIHNKTQYLGISGEKLNFPGISAAAAEWIVNSGKFYGVGIDTASVDPGTSVDFETHRILNSNLLYTLENVKLEAEIPFERYMLIISPMKLSEGSGAPARIYAIDKSSQWFRIAE